MTYNVPDILYSKIRIKRSLISGETPNSLELGELAANVPDKKLWIGDETNNPIEFVLSGSSGPGSGQTYFEGVGISISSGNVISIDLTDPSIPNKSMNTRILNPPNSNSGVLYWSQEYNSWQIRDILEYVGSDTIDVNNNNEISVKNQSIGLQHLAEPPLPQENMIIKWQSGGWFYGIDQSGGSGGGGGGITFSDLFSCIGGVYNNQWFINGGNSTNIFCDTSADGSETGPLYTEGYGINISSNNEISFDVTILQSLTSSITPSITSTYNLGSSSLRWNNVYCINVNTGDLNLSNENSSGNLVDGSTGNWTIQEGENDLFLINNKNGKRYKFVLSEIL